MKNLILPDYLTKKQKSDIKRAIKITFPWLYNRNKELQENNIEKVLEYSGNNLMGKKLEIGKALRIDTTIVKAYISKLKGAVI